MQNTPNIYYKILDLAFRVRGTKYDQTAVSMENGQFTKNKTGAESLMLRQDFYLAASDLYERCTSAEWLMIGQIASELKQNNMLWRVPDDIKRSGAKRNALKGLKDKQIIVPTETTGIFFVNPFHVRRGEFFTCLHATAYALMDSESVETAHIKALTPPNSFDGSFDAAVSFIPEEEQIKLP